jgi:hypothetical protein
MAWHGTAQHSIMRHMPFVLLKQSMLYNVVDVPSCKLDK